MRRIPLLLACLALLQAGCFKSAAFKRYLAFTEQVRNGNCERLKVMMAPGSQAENWMNEYCAYGPYAGRPSAAKMVAELSGTPQAASRRFKHTIESEIEADDGTVTLVVIEHPIARPSNFNSPPPDYRQTLKLKPSGE